MESGLTLWGRRIVIIAKRVGKAVRNFTINRNIFGFLIFLCIAIGFWFLMTFKDRTSLSAEYVLDITNVPKNIIYTSEVPQTINITLNGRGFSLLRYMLQAREKKLRVDYADLVKVGGIITIDNYIWRKTITKELPSDITYTSIVPSSVEIYYSLGDHKQVPVIFTGKVQTSEQHLLCGLEIKPQYIDIYAPAPQFDTITAVYTEPIMVRDATDTISMSASLQAIKGVKMVPDTVNIQACVDLLTSKTLKVPIYCENIPENKTLRTFPLMAEVTFQVSATMFNVVAPEDFIIVVDYNAIEADDSKCRLLTRQVPDGIFNVRVSPTMVDYVIEQDE